MIKIKTLLIFLVFLSVSQTSNSIATKEIKIFDNEELICGIKNEALQLKVIQWLGTPYKAGSNSLQGTDCSGFVKMIFKEVFQVDLVHSSRDMIKQVTILKKKTELMEGDLLFFKMHRHRISHVGIYLRDGYFIHSSSSNGVEIASLESAYYKKTFYKAGRVSIENIY